MPIGDTSLHRTHIERTSGEGQRYPFRVHCDTCAWESYALTEQDAEIIGQGHVQRRRFRDASQGMRFTGQY